MSAKTYLIDGKELELYTIGELSKQLDRQRQTLRKWEKNGIIPQATYRSGSNQRLYSKNQIIAIVGCVEKYNLKQGYPIPKEFVEEVHQVFEIATQMDFEEEPAEE